MNRLILLAPVLLAACNSGPAVTAQNASVGEVAEQVAKAQAGGQFIAPGRWEATMTIEKLEIPGMPPEMAKKMESHMGKGRVIVSCLTPEEVKKPKEGFFGGQEGNCRYDRFTMADGKIDGEMKCSGDGANRTMTMTGTYSPDTYTMSVSSTGQGTADNPMGAMSMKMTMAAKRTGACTGKEDQ